MTAALANNVFAIQVYPVDAYAKTFTITVPDGSYTVADLNSYFQYYCIQNSLYLVNADGNYVYLASFAVNAVKYCIELQTISCPYNGDLATLPVGYTLPVGFPLAPAVGASWNAVVSFPNAGMASYFGFAVGFTTDANSGNTTTLAYLSSIAPQIQPNPSVLISLNGINNKYTASPVIYSFSSAGVNFGDMISERPNNLLWSNLNAGTYNELRVTFLGTDLRPMTLLDPSITMLLVIKSNLS